MIDPQPDIFERLSRAALAFCHPDGWTNFCADSFVDDVGCLEWLWTGMSAGFAIEAGLVERHPTDEGWLRLTDAGRAARGRVI